MKEIKMKKIVVAILLLGMMSMPGLSLAGDKDVLRVAQMADVTSLDPAKSNSYGTANVLKIIYSYLVNQKRDMSVGSDLAESWTQPDPNTWIFKIRKGVVCHNGETLDAEDVVFSLNRVKDPETKSAGAGFLKGVEIEYVDQYTVKITTENPYAPLLVNLSRYEMGITDKNTVLKYGDDFAKVAIGSGPFKLKNRVPGTVTVERFDDYYGEKPKLKEIIFRAIPEAATRVIELESGNVDILAQLPPEEYKRLEKNKNIIVFRNPSNVTIFFGLNRSVKPMENKLVRQAFNYAIDKQAVINSASGGFGQPSRGPLSPMIWGFDNTIKPIYPYNPEKAKDLLKKAGYPNGFKCTIMTDARTIRKTSAELIQAYLSEVGVQAEIQQIEWPTLLKKTRVPGGAHIYAMGWTGTGDADGGMFARFHSSGIGANNRHHWSTPEMDALLEKGRAEMSPEKRKAIYAQLQKTIIDEAYDIFLWIQEEVAATGANVKNFQIYSNTITPWNIIYKTE